MNNKNDSAQDITRHSKFLSLVLRHEPQKIGLHLDDAGWASVQDLLRCLADARKSMSLQRLEHIVAQDSKQRFSFSEDGQRIRANQGHSIAVELGLPEQVPPDVLHHGTATRFLDSILREGLTKQSRHHVHLSEDLTVAGTVGRRYGKLVILDVDTQRMRDNGHVFYRSDNGVWLTDAVPPQFLKARESL